MNIDPNKIIIVYPKEDAKKKMDRFDCFNNPYVSNVMRGVLADAGIKVYDSHVMKQWNSGEWEAGHRIDTVTFEKLNLKSSEKPTEFIEFNCDVSLTYFNCNIAYFALRLFRCYCVIILKMWIIIPSCVSKFFVARKFY